MRQLTLKGFLESYILELSYAGTSSINKLIKELDINPRLREPLILHGIMSGMPMSIRDKAPEFYNEYEWVMHKINKPSLLVEQIEILPNEYQKVITSYMYERDKIENDNHTKLLMREKIIQIQRQKSITNYRIYTELELNQGNANSFLKNGDVSKLSLENVREMLNYVRSYK